MSNVWIKLLIYKSQKVLRRFFSFAIHHPKIMGRLHNLKREKVLPYVVRLVTIATKNNIFYRNLESKKCLSCILLSNLQVKSFQIHQQKTLCTHISRIFVKCQMQHHSHKNNFPILKAYHYLYQKEIFRQEFYYNKPHQLILFFIIMICILTSPYCTSFFIITYC